MLAAAVVAVAAFAAHGDVGKADSPIKVDGALSDPAWTNVKWESGFRRVKIQEKKGLPRGRTSFAILADSRNIYVGVRCFDPDMEKVRTRPDGNLWGSDNIELFFSPDGTTFDFYHFAVGPRSKDVCTEYLSEGGHIRPDPYAPAWEHATGFEKDCWTAEFRIPLSAFYMTRNASWKTKWLFNIGRTFAGPYELATFAPMEAKFLEPKNFAELEGFPLRVADDDVAVRTVTAEMDGVRDGQLTGSLKLDVYVATAGEYLLRTSASAADVKVRLCAGGNKCFIPCTYVANGRCLTHISLQRLPDGQEAACDYPVIVDFQAIRVKLSVPQYRNNFYPGQDTSKVVGKVAVASGEKAKLTLEGPGFVTRTANPSADGSFVFDTTGFATGDAWLTVTAGEATKKVKIRNLPKTGHRMAWIQDGNLVIDGRPTLRRNIYADFWKQGECFAERYKADMENFCKTSECDGSVGIEMKHLMSGLERKEGTRDIRPCAEYLKKIDELIEKNRDRDFTSYYISDEPECRGVSPVYLRHVYEYVAEKDPYHPIRSATRGGKAYIDSMDWAETHPYLDPRVPDENGVRTYGKAPNEIGRFLDAFEAWDRPDKCIGFLPTCFAYRWNSSSNDYPTFDEYVLHTWAAMMRGGKTLWPYAGHDLGDRAALYEGTKYIFSSFAALEPLVLHGKRTTFARSTDEEGVLYTLGDEKMFVIVNFSFKPRKVALPGVTGSFREFRGTRTWKTGCFFGRTLEPIELQPLETIVACTEVRDTGLPTLAEVRALVDRKERERTTRDNQLLERYDDIVVSSNMKANFGGGFYKLIDGTRDFLARHSSGLTNATIEVSFPKFAACFSKARVWGSNVGSLTVDVRNGGIWRTLSPVRVTREKWMTEMDFGETISTVKVRFRFPMKPGKNQIEVYELELPKAGVAAMTTHKVPAKKDIGVKWRLTDKDAVCTNVWSDTFWYGKNSEVVQPTMDGGFTVTGRVTKYLPMDPDHRWLVMDIAKFCDRTTNGYCAWFSRMIGVEELASTVTHPQAGIYTLQLSPAINSKRVPFRLDVHGLGITFNSISCMAKPANRVDLLYTNGLVRVRVYLASPAEEVTGEFLVARSYGNLNPFLLNGSHAIEMESLDASGCVWGKDMKVIAAEKAPARSVYVKASALGSEIRRPIFGNFAEAFP